ncbi:MAG: 30S ribosome-binding factor RbfA [Actinomyces sp.]|uniref:30S ribosome-binding factor RbfA n=1 Tax=unclassified Actinomyces TaxID=2609248 RepID=UPI0008A1A75C|nr:MULTISPECIES: 30S ribosome-binding factor RbfA [unclassified Actinomyces]MBS6102106.1 30S ribosome-binding factor RbfA [Actinomyces sp.]MDU4831923.1 30S ribosome-binding factor RbfA [Actinomyces sp.]MDU6679500.1 30S ribosome-binding factor RbfA [Actinomyces sp.]OFR31724.1 ribosome-binding factor A [Actinomyces sp. HMSC065F11]
MADINRQRKVEDRIQQTVARLLERRIKDPRLGFVTVTDVRVTGDLQHATIFYTVLGSADEAAKSAKALESAKGLIRSEVGKALGIRLTPTIDFQADSLPQAAADIEEALLKARKADEELAQTAKNAKYAGEEDPYKSAEEE